MPLVDEEGNLFGRWNVVDVVVVLFVAGALIAGVSLLVEPGSWTGNDESQLRVVVEGVERPFVTTALADAGSCQSGASIAGVAVADSWYNESERADYQRVRVTATIDAERRDGMWRYEGDPVRVGAPITLESCEVRLEGTVVDVRGVRE